MPRLDHGSSIVQVPGLHDAYLTRADVLAALSQLMSLPCRYSTA